MLPLLLGLYVSRLGEAGAPLHPRINSEINNHLAYMNVALGDKHYFLGPEFSAVDVQLGFVVEAANRYLGAYPHLQAFMERIRARPAYQRAITRGGPYKIG